MNGELLSSDPSPPAASEELQFLNVEVSFTCKKHNSLLGRNACILPNGQKDLKALILFHWQTTQQSNAIINLMDSGAEQTAE